MQIDDLAGSVGKGLAAGVVGTAATVSSNLEAKLRGRTLSAAPVLDAASTRPPGD